MAFTLACPLAVSVECFTLYCDGVLTKGQSDQMRFNTESSLDLSPQATNFAPGAVAARRDCSWSQISDLTLKRQCIL